MKINKKVYLLGAALLTMVSSTDVWSSVTCIKCKNDPDKYCKYRNQGPEVVECFKKCGANSAFGQQGITACLHSMTLLKDPGPWDDKSKRAFVTWYQEINGAVGLTGWTSENRDTVVKLVSEFIVPLPKDFHPMMYLALNPDLYDKVKELKYDEALKGLATHYEEEGGSAHRPFVPDNTHKVQLVEGLDKESGFNAMEFLTSNPIVDAKYKTQNMTLTQVLLDVEMNHSLKKVEKPKKSGDSGRAIPKAPINAMMYLALNPDLLNLVKNMPLKQAINILTDEYHQEGRKQNRAVKPDETHRVPGYHSETRPNGLPNHFNPIEYISLHDDLLGHYMNQNMPLAQVLSDAEAHYLHFGSLEARTFTAGFSDAPKASEVKQVSVKFDPMIYLGLHPDLAKHFGGLPIDEALRQASQHYEQHGKGEHRAIAPSIEHPVPALAPPISSPLPKGFNAAIYLAQHQDVFNHYAHEQVSGHPKTLSELFFNAAEHYAQSGRHENRAHEYNPESQKVIADEGSSAHEGPSGFDPLLYLAMNMDLASAFGDLSPQEALKQISAHYTNHGKGEGRFAAPTNTHPAQTFHPGGISMDATAKLPKGFNVALYLAQNKQVFDRYAQSSKTLNMLLAEAAQNYATDAQGGKGGSGSNKGKADKKQDDKPNDHAQPIAFDPLIYLAVNKDLVLKFKDMPIKDALEQAQAVYETEGKGSKRLVRPKTALTPALFIPELMGSPKDFGPGFNPLIYLSLHQDLYNAFSNGGQATLGEVIKAASAHFVNHGRDEGRGLSLPVVGGQPQGNAGPKKPVQQQKPNGGNLFDALSKFNKGDLKPTPMQEKPKTQKDALLEAFANTAQGRANAEAEKEKKGGGAANGEFADDDEWSD
jgi:hypothetical protein